MRLRSNLLNFFRFRINFQSEKLQNVKRDLALLADYFLHASRKKRIIAWLLVISIILCAVASVGLMAVLAWWNAGFFAALIAKDIVMLKTSCIIFTGIMLGFVAISSL
jgi:putative ATP-binding cassette transporter